MNEYPELNLLGRTQAATYTRLTQVTSSGLNLYDLVDGTGNKITTLNLSSSYAISSSVTIITQSVATQSLFALSASWASSSLTSISASYSLTSSHAIFSKTASFISSSGTVIVQSGNNLMEVINSSSIQRLNVYTGFNNTASFGRISIYGLANDYIIEANGSGSFTSNGDLQIKHANNHSIKFFTNGTNRWTVGSSGDFLPGASTYNIGQVGQGVNNLWVSSINGNPSIFASTISASVLTASNVTVRGDLADMYLFNTQSALWIQTSGSPSLVGLGNGVVYSDLGFQAGGGSGYFDVTQTANRVAVWNVLNPFLSSSIVLVSELNTLSGIATGSTLQTQLNSKSTLTTGSTYLITSSWAANSQTASTITPYQTYTTITTGSHLITLDYTKSKQYVFITTGALYNFTSSNPPPTGQTADVTLYIDNSAVATSSFSFPTDWIFIGGMPLSITSSKNAVLSIEAFGNKTVAAYGFQQ